MFPFTRVPFWYRFFEPQPNNNRKIKPEVKEEIKNEIKQEVIK